MINVVYDTTSFISYIVWYFWIQIVFPLLTPEIPGRLVIVTPFCIFQIFPEPGGPGGKDFVGEYPVIIEASIFDDSSMRWPKLVGDRHYYYSLLLTWHCSAPYKM